MALVSTLVDDFSGTSLDTTKWGNSYGGTAIASGRVAIPTTTGYPGLGSTAQYTLTASSLYGKVTPATGTTGAEQFFFGFQDLPENQVNQVQGYVFGAGTVAWKGTINGTSWDANTGLTPAQAPWWRIREASNVVYFDTSLDGITWTQRLTQTYTGTCPAMYVYAFSGNYSSDTPSNLAYVDNINTNGSTAKTGEIKAYVAGAWTPKPVKMWNGTAWVTKPLKRWSGTAWITTPY